MALRSDKEGFLQGDAIKLDQSGMKRAVEVWKSIKSDTSAIRKALLKEVQTSAKAMSAAPSRKIFTDKQVGALSQRIAQGVKTATMKRGNGLSPVARSGPSVMPARDASGRFVAASITGPAANSSTAQKDKKDAKLRDESGKFKGDGKGKGGFLSFFKGMFGNKERSAVVDAIKDGMSKAGENTEDIDPVIKATKEVKGAVDNVAGATKATYAATKGIFNLSSKAANIASASWKVLRGGGDKSVPWYKRIVKELKTMNEKKEKSGGGGDGGGFFGGIASSILPGLAKMLPMALSGLAVAGAAILGTAIGTWINDKFGDQIASFIDTVSKGIGGAVDAITSAWTSASDFVKDGWKTIKDKTSDAVDAVTETADKGRVVVLESYDTAKTAVQQTVNRAGVKLGIGKASENKTALMAQMSASGITDPKEQAMFMAQMDHESGGFGHMEESFNYRSADRIMANSKTARNAGADKVKAAMAQGPEAVAEMMYGGRMGNSEKGDGYKFRGRGFTQLTGKDNYAAASKDLGIDLLKNPDLAASPEVASKVATWYWKKNGLGAAGKAGDVGAATQKINGGQNGLADRTDKYNAYLAQAQSGGLTVASAKTAMPSTGLAGSAAPGMPPIMTATAAQSLDKVTPPPMAPVNSMIASSGKSDKTVVEVKQGIGQNPSDRSIAQIATGGIGSGTRSG